MMEPAESWRPSWGLSEAIMETSWKLEAIMEAIGPWIMEHEP